MFGGSVITFSRRFPESSVYFIFYFFFPKGKKKVGLTEFLSYSGKPFGDLRLHAIMVPFHILSLSDN